MEQGQQQYIGFWARFVAFLVNSILLGVAIWALAPILGFQLQGGDLSLEQMQAQLLQVQGFNLACGVAFFVGAWIVLQSDPGKMLFGAVIVDAKTGGKPSPGQMVLRYVGYFVSTLVLFLGFVWIAFDARKQGWHDKIAGTVVIKKA